MTKLMRLLGALLFATLVTACGGGGGSPGTTSGGSTGGGGGTPSTPSTPATSTPTIVLELRDATDKVVTTVTSSPLVYAKVTVKNGAGAPASGEVVAFSGDSSLVKFLPASGTALTDANGLASVQVLPSSASAAGAGVLTALTTVAGVALAPATAAFQVPIVSGNNSTPSLLLGLRDSSNASTNLVDRATTTMAQAVLMDSAGLPVAGTVVTFSGDAQLIKFSPTNGAVLTNASGVAAIQISPASISSAGAGTLLATASVGGTPVTKSFDYRLPPIATAGVPTIGLSLRDAANAATNAVSSSGVTTARATVLDAAGVPVVGRLVSFQGDAGLIKLNPASGQVLTDSAGIANVQVTPASLSSAGASTLSASTTVAAAALTTSFDFQLSAANLGLQSLDLGSGPLAAYGNRAVSVLATINGAPAANTAVQVTFSASCGTIAPAVVTTDSTGKASTTLKADNASCAGSNVTVSASAVGATPLSGTVAVAASLATNVQFVSATPELIYLAGSVGPTQSQVRFKVVDSSGNPLQNQQLQLSLVNSAPGASLNTVANTQPVTLSSDAAGIVSIALFSGTVPTSVQVRAVLTADTSVSATSNVLRVASGRPVQRATSVALERFSVEGLNVDGATSKVTISLADRQGNPVPDGTQVNFVTKYGLMVPATCIVSGGTSSCSVQYRSQGDRGAPFAGRAAILAYVPGEEDFVDLNGNNAYDPGEPFTDLGNAYRDEYTSSNGLPDGTFTTGEFIVPRAGASTCLGAGAPNNGGVNGRDGTCDGVWGTVDVRTEVMIQVASSQALMVAHDVTSKQFDVTIMDVNGNSMPTGSTITVGKVSGRDDCAIGKFSPTVIPNTYLPTDVNVLLNKCGSGDVIAVTITTPGLAAGPTATLLSVTLP